MSRGWEGFWFQPATGVIGGRAELHDGGQWDVTLNRPSTATVTVSKKQARQVSPDWWSLWSGGMLLLYNDIPILLGVVEEVPVETATSLELHLSDCRAILARRHVLTDLTYSGISLGTIGWRLVEHAMTRPNGWLPIEHGSAEETADRTRTYKGWNIKNNAIDKLLTELSGVINGPDIMFRPMVEPGESRAWWSMHHGSQNFPAIPQADVALFNQAAPISNLQAIDVQGDGQYYAHRVWYTGATPEETESPLVVSGPGADRKQFEPLIELVLSDSTVETEALLVKRYLEAYPMTQEPFRQMTISVSMSQTGRVYGQAYHVGDTARVQPSGWLTMSNDELALRIVQARGNIGSDKVQLGFQQW